MRYWLDTEFNEFGGELISLALVREDNESIYLVYPKLPKYGEWVTENILPILWSIPNPLPGMAYNLNDHSDGAYLLANFFRSDDTPPIIIADWPEDISNLCRALLVGPGMMVNLRVDLIFKLVKASAYPTTVPNAVQHNSWWDAQALKALFKTD